MTSADSPPPLVRGGLVGLVIGPDGRAALATGEGAGVVSMSWLAEADEESRPRWAMWSHATARVAAEHGVRLSTAWDVESVHRLLAGGWRAEPARVWAWLQGLDRSRLPSLGQLDLLSVGDGGGDPEEPVQPDGYLRPEWLDGGWSSTNARRCRWATLVLEVAELQMQRLADARALATARAESTAALLCAELEVGGLPVDREAARALISSLVGPPPANEAEAEAMRRERDDAVLSHLPPGSRVDLRNPADVKAMLRRVGIDVPDTRAWRLEAMRTQHPVVDALLHWRKAERVATTYGHAWLDAHVGADGRLRGDWSASDGAAGRMTAQAGLHNLPAELRPIVRAEAGHVFVRADLGQIEPRVLAAVSGDRALQVATQSDDLYAPVAHRLGVERPVAKVAVLAAMYGQTSGTAGQALRGMQAAYPVAIRFLDDAAERGRNGEEFRTYGGRLVRMFEITDGSDYAGAAAARGRYARNASIQGAAAELFKVWAVTVRARGRALGAEIVLCLHDELLVHVPEEHAPAVAALMDDCLAEAAHRVYPGIPVRFVTDTSTVKSWSDAKP